MYIEPNSTIEIFAGIPLNPNYKDTMYFLHPNHQSAWFESEPGVERMTFTNQMYQRKDKNTCRLEVNAERIYNYTYMRFRNDAFGTKWFYAFITKVEYLNNRVSEITYEIDVMQTWCCDYLLRDCFVEREHSATDEIGEHLLPEPVDPSETQVVSSRNGGFNELVIVLLRGLLEDEPLTGGNLRDGIFSEVKYDWYEFNDSGAGQLAQEIKRLEYTPNGKEVIISVHIAPKQFVLYNTGGNLPYNHLISGITYPNNFDGYIPNNNKMFTYPYNYLVVDSLNDSKEYRYELFKNGVKFRVAGSAIGDVSALCAPEDYEIDGINWSEQIAMGGYPQCPVSISAYKQWIANNGVSTLMTGIGGAVGAVASGNPFIQLASLATLVSSTHRAVVESNKGATSRGPVTTYVNAQNRTKDFYFRCVQLKKEKAKSIDDYFSRYGYACERVKVPNRAVRNRWTYTKTNGCIVAGKVPADDLAKIAKIFDNGITFWRKDLGLYVLNDNGVL